MARFAYALCFSVFTLWAALAQAEETFSYNVQCWAEGHNFRVMDQPKNDQLTSTRLFLDVQQKGDSVVLQEYLGHVSGAKFVDGKSALETVDFYSLLVGKDHPASLSATARVYLDKDYWRFARLKSRLSTNDDGGHLNGTLVLAKVPQKTNPSRFDAHLIFQHGDHTGGTIDLTCEKR